MKLNAKVILTACGTYNAVTNILVTVQNKPQ